jgi:hypothetical protein
LHFTQTVIVRQVPFFHFDGNRVWLEAIWRLDIA